MSRLITIRRGSRMPNAVEFDGQPAAPSIPFGHAYPPVSTNMSHCFYEAAIAPRKSGYVFSHGYGGAHAMLLGVTGVDDTYMEVTGNVWDITGASARSFSADHRIGPLEWGLLSCRFDATTPTVYVFWNGICISKIAVTIGAGGRGPNSTADNHLFLGGSDHSNYGGRIAWARLWERGDHPQGGDPIDWGWRPSLHPRRYVGDSTKPAGWLMAFNAGDGVCEDTSARGISHTATATEYVRHHGIPLDHGPISGNVANDAFNDQRHGANPPRWIHDGSCPFFRRRGLILPVTLARTAIAAPGGERIWDSFGRRDQTLLFDDVPSLGSTEAGSLGARTWVQKGTTGQTYRHVAQWGLLNLSAIYFDTAPGGHAIVDNASANQDVRIRRRTGTGHTGECGIAFRALNNAGGDHWIAHHTLAYGGTSRVKLGRWVAGAFTQQILIDAADNAWSWLRVTVDGANDIKVWTSTDGAAWRQEGATQNNATLSGGTYCGLSVCDISTIQSSLARYREFRVL